MDKFQHFQHAVLEFLKAMRFYMFTDGGEAGLTPEARRELVESMAQYEVGGEPWHEQLHHFDVRLMNLVRCLGFVIKPERDYQGTEAILTRDLRYLREFPVQELIYWSVAMREHQAEYAAPFGAAFIALAEELREIFDGFGRPVPMDDAAAGHFFMEVMEFVAKYEHLVPIVENRFWAEDDNIRRVRERFAALQAVQFEAEFERTEPPELS